MRNIAVSDDYMKGETRWSYRIDGITVRTKYQVNGISETVTSYYKSISFRSRNEENKSQHVRLSTINFTAKMIKVPRPSIFVVKPSIFESLTLKQNDYTVKLITHVTEVIHID